MTLTEAILLRHGWTPRQLGMRTVPIAAEAGPLTIFGVIDTKPGRGKDRPRKLRRRMRTTKTAVSIAALMLAGISASKAAINPAAQWSAALAGVGYPYYDSVDGTLWVATGQSMTAVSPSEHGPVFSQFMGSTAQDCDVDTAKNNLWCVGQNSGITYVSVFNMTESVQTSGQAPYTVWTGSFANGGPYSISVDATDRVAFITSGGILIEWSIKADEEGIVAQFTPPDGYPVQNATYMPICDTDTGLMISTLGKNGEGYGITDYWYYDLQFPNGKCIQGGDGYFPGSGLDITGQNNEFVPLQILKPIYVFGYGEQIVSESAPPPNGSGGSWLIFPPFGQAGVAYLNYNIDAYMNTYPLAPKQVTGQALDMTHTIYITVVTTFDDAVMGNPPGPNQVLFAPATGGAWPYPGEVQPGITVNGATFATVDAAGRVAYTTGGGTITAISY